MDLLCLPQHLRLVYLVANRAYWSREFQIEAHILCQQGVFAGWQNVEMFSVRVPDRPNYYCKVTAWWAQYEDSDLLFDPTPLILPYYSSLEARASADDKSRLWTISLTE